MEMKKVAKKQEIWNNKEETVRSEEVKKLVLEYFHR